MNAERDEQGMLDADAQAMLAALRDEEALPAEIHDRVWARVEASMAAPERSPWRRVGVVAFAAAAAIVLVTLSSRGVLTARDDARPAQAGYERAEAAGDTAHALDASDQTDHAGSRDASEHDASEHDASEHDASERDAGEHGTHPNADAQAATVDRDAPARREGKPRANGATSSSSTLAEERALLEKTRAALLADDPSRALSHLREHARRFPHGVLTEERQALRAVALCQGGDPSGSATATSFLRAHPTSPLAAKVRAACRSTSP